MFYLSGLVYGSYPKVEVHNLGRFISVTKFRPLTWRVSHPYILADRYVLQKRHVLCTVYLVNHNSVDVCQHFIKNDCIYITTRSFFFLEKECCVVLPVIILVSIVVNVSQDLPVYVHVQCTSKKTKRN